MTEEQENLLSVFYRELYGVVEDFERALESGEVEEGLKAGNKYAIALEIHPEAIK